MKTAFAILVALCVSTYWTNAQTASSSSPTVGTTGQDTPYAVVSKGANQQVWQKTTYETLPSGQTVPHIHQYTELATGLNFWNSTIGQWVDSKEEIDILPNGTAAATQGQHTVTFPGNIYQGVITLVTPDGKQLQSQPIGLSYYDGSNTVLMAELTNSVGYLVGSNQVLYPNAFTDFKADLLYTYTKAGFEQNIILREAPLTPESYGLNPATARLQVLTEFFNPPQPTVTTTVLPEQAGIVLTDENLNFGVMEMTPGRAFLLGSNANEPGVQVSKSWAMLDGRQFLVEEVPVEALADELAQLPGPQTASTKPNANSALHVVSAKRLLPAPRLTKTSPAGQFKQVAQAATPARGLVLDYQTISGISTNYTYQSDTTYYISGNLNSYGTNTFEGGAVLKFATNGEIQITPGPPGTSPGINWKAGAYRPVIFTAKDDNSVGDSVGTNTLTGYYGNPMLYLVSFTPPAPLIGLRMAYAKTAIQFSGASANLYNVQIVSCLNGINIAGANVFLGNALFANTTTNFIFGGSATVTAEHATIGGSLFLATAPSTQTHSSIILTNCILANVTNLISGVFYVTNGNYNGFYNTPEVWDNPVTNNYCPFQTVGAGSYYLTNGCRFSNAGTTNIDSTLLSILQQKTTYPPIIYNVPGVYFSTSLNLFPQAQRDTDVPDLGYHYDPLDYIFGTIYVTNATITVNPGTAIAVYGTNSGTYGFGMAANAQFLCQGSPNSLARVVEYNTVQEQTPAGWLTTSYGLVAGAWGGNPTINCHFTDWSVMAQDASHVQVSGAVNSIYFQDCQFHGGKLVTSRPTINLTNCLLERVNVDFEPTDTNVTVIRNNLFWGGTFGFYPAQTNCIIKDNSFDHATIPDWLGAYGITYVGGHNAFVTNYDKLDPTFPGDIILSNSPVYQSSWLGNYYLPTNSPLVYAGSTNANLVGLYHYTVTTNQVVEGTNTVSIGYHYVATDTNGIPIDTNGDGIADYLEDANGNGLVDSGEIGWNIYGDLGLNVLITRPRNGSTLP